MAAALSHPLRRLRDRPGLVLSLLLHLGFALLALWYVAVRPVTPPPRTLPADLVVLAPTPGHAGAPPAPHAGAPRPQREAAPQKEGVAPNATRQPEDELTAQLRALAQLRAPDTDLAIGGGDGAGQGQGRGDGAYALRDYIRAQILRRWLPDLSTPASRDIPVLLRLTVSAKGVISDIAITDQARFASDRAFHDMALSARNAAILASPIVMPPGRWPARQVLEIDLSPRDALR